VVALVCFGTRVAQLRADPVISEFMAANTLTLADNDGAYSDWLELYNPDPTAVDLNGWYLTDSASTKTKWRIPAVTIAPGGYLLIFASNKNRQDPNAPLHTNFALSAKGEYLALVKPDSQTVVSEYNPFPAQTDNVSFGLPALPSGGFGPPTFLGRPTPGAP